MPHHTAPSSAGEPTDFAMPAGVRKMPSEMASPVTTAMAAHTPICRPPCRSLRIVRVSYAGGGLTRILHLVEAGPVNRGGSPSLSSHTSSRALDATRPVAVSSKAYGNSSEHRSPPRSRG